MRAEYAEAPMIRDAGPRRLNLEPVKPLLEYLDRLTPHGQERGLTWEEDVQAVFILKSLIPEDLEEARVCAEDFTLPRYRKRRTLGHWYLYAQHVARKLQNVH